MDSMSKRYPRRMSQDDKKSRFPIFGINFHGTVLDKMENEFYNRVTNGLRQHVSIFSIAELKNELMEELGLEFDTPLSVKDTRFDKLIEKILSRINKFTIDYNNFLKELAAFNEFDLLQYWKDTKGIKIPLLKGVERPKDRNLDEKKSAKNQTDSDFDCDGTKASFVPLITHRFSNVGLAKTKEAFVDHIDDMPSKGVKQYIIMLGADNDIYLELLTKGVMFRSILNIFPTGTRYAKKNIEIIEKTLQPLKDSPLTKPVAIFIEYTEPLSECGVKLYSQEIYDQIVWSLYNAENLFNYSYSIYEDRFLEISVSEMAPCINLKIEPKLPYSYNIDVDVLSYFQELMSQVNAFGSLKNFDAKELFRINIFEPNIYDSIIIENSNSLLKTAYQSNLGTQYFRNHEKFYYNLLESRLFQIINDCERYSNNRQCFGDHFIETFSLIAFMQRFNYLLNNYDEIEIQSNSKYNTKLFKFEKTLNTLIVKKQINVISNKNCFRDFVEFTFKSIQPILANVEKNIRNDEISPGATDSSRRGGSITFSFFEDYIRHLSIKYQLKQASHRYGDIPRKIGSTVGVSIEPIYREPLFNGYEIGDGAYQQLETIKSIYRFKYGFIQVIMEQFMYSIPRLTLTLNLCGTDIYYHSSFNKQNIAEQIRIVTNLDVAITLNTKQTNMYGILYYIPFVNLLWPNGFSIINDTINILNLPYQCVIQTPCKINKDTYEKKRIFLSNGAVVIYYDHGIRVLLGNGTIYENQTPLHLTNSEIEIDVEMEIYRQNERERDIDRQMEIASALMEYEERIKETGDIKKFDTRNSIDQKPKTLINQNNQDFQNNQNYQRLSNYEKETVEEEDDNPEYLPRTESELLIKQFHYEIYFIETLAPHIGFDCKKFRLTTSTGRNLEIINGKIAHENHRYLLTEWNDYANERIFVRREDGVLMVWSNFSFECYYPDGTIISTTTVKCEVDLFNKHNEDEFDPKNVRSSEYTAKSIIDGLLNILDDYALTICFSVYYMQHEDYASVRFTKDDIIELSTPNDIEIAIASSMASLKIGNFLLLEYTENKFVINEPPSFHPNKTFTPVEIYSLFYGKMGFFPNEPILNFAYGNHLITIDEKGTMSLSKIGEDDCESDFEQAPVKIEKKLLYEDGQYFEIFSNDEIEEKFMNKEYIYKDKLIESDTEEEDDENDDVRKAKTEQDLKKLLETYYIEDDEEEEIICTSEVMPQFILKSDYKALVVFEPIINIMDKFKVKGKFIPPQKEICPLQRKAPLKLPRECTYRILFARTEDSKDFTFDENKRMGELMKGIESFVRIPSDKKLKKRAKHIRNYFRNMFQQKQRRYIYFAMKKYQIYPKYPYYKVSDFQIKNYDIVRWFEEICFNN